VLDNQIIGWADIIPFERNTMNHVGHLGMGVLADFRDMGIGSKLLEKQLHMLGIKN
jgi:putative acetyltransferase